MKAAGAACGDGELSDKVCEATPVSFKFKDGSILVSPCKEMRRRKGGRQAKSSMQTLPSNAVSVMIDHD